MFPQMFKKLPQESQIISPDQGEAVSETDTTRRWSHSSQLGVETRKQVFHASENDAYWRVNSNLPINNTPGEKKWLHDAAYL